MNKKGFTLIELLIVVAIIGILAAIAVPNFLNAQMRAKVARVVSDMKALAMAQEQYRMDNGQYTYDGDCGIGGGEFRSYIPLTTPVSYISNYPQDAFANSQTEFQNQQNIRAGLRPVFEYTSRVSFGPNGTSNCKNTTATYDTLGRIGVEYLMTSLGPDNDQDFPWSVQAYQDVAKGTGQWVYETSNGLNSSGNIYVLNSRIVGAGN